MSETAAWGAVFAVACGALGTLLGGLIVAWYRSKGEYQVNVIKAQASLNVDELAKSRAENVAKDHSIDVLKTRVEQLETNIKDLRDQHHNEREKYHLEALKAQKETYERELRCHAEAAELRGQLTVLLKLVSDRLPGPPIDVHVKNAIDDPVPTRIQGEAPAI